ncbi:Cytochrome b5-like heme/steroid binding domain [Macleaya cordata]|uniref:Cytochrome b5-like heme/steroid binding domain n=1 Tax=Macleaya cordata TaxID=56857 RepID=A0A200QNV8_MACCD|nr:Cytochrome b5-like heme/steroid binding domain [Macleaya cordata]
MFYGPGGPYALFAGRDASRALALMSFEPSDLTGNIEGLSSSELDTLQDWEYKFMEKYVKVGQIVTGAKAEDIANVEKTEENQEQSKVEAMVLKHDSSSIAADTDTGN